MDKIISDWQKLLERIEIQKESLTLATETELLEFEKRTGITLPVGYKEYCQVFGQGQIGNGVIEIHNPYRRDIDICFGLSSQTVFPLQLQKYLDEISLTFDRYG